MSDTHEVVIVGAGMAGLSAARRLSADYDVVVIDKARGVGGRVATRRIGAATFDHGAQFLTTHSDEFAGVVASWETAGVVRTWFRSRIGPGGAAVDDSSRVDGHRHYRGSVSMNAIAKHVADGLELRLSTRAVSVAPLSDGWRVEVDGGEPIDARALLITAPAPQALALLDAGGTALAASDRQSLESIRYEPCLAVLATLDGPSEVPDPGARAPDGGPIGWIADNRTKGISELPAVTIHATAGYSAAMWDSNDDLVADELLSAASLPSAPVPVAVQVQRWRFATPVQLHDEPVLKADGHAPLLFAGDAFGGAKVEGAVLSGRAAAAAVRARPARPGGSH